MSLFKGQLFKNDLNRHLATLKQPSVGYFGNYNISIHSCSDTYGGTFETHSTAALKRLVFEIADIDYDSSLEEKT
jgi:hypothetical protein